jgi:hypothetical protein
MVLYRLALQVGPKFLRTEVKSSVMVHSLLARDLKLVPTEAILFPMEASLLVSLVEANLAPTED